MYRLTQGEFKMKQTQVLKTFLKSWETRLSKAQEELSSSGSVESRVKVEVLQAVVRENEDFFQDFQVVKRPARKGRKPSKVDVAEDRSKVSTDAPLSNRSSTEVR